MMTFVTASIASGNKDTISRTPTFATTIRGDASHTIRKIGKVLRSAARRSFQRGTGFAIRGANYSSPYVVRNSVALHPNHTQRQYCSASRLPSESRGAKADERAAGRS